MITLSIVTAALGVTLGIVIKQTLSYYRKNYLPHFSQKKIYTIAIIFPSQSPYVVTLTHGFTSYLKKYAPFKFEIERYNTHGSLKLIKSSVEHALERRVDVILCLGKNPTFHAAHAIRVSDKQEKPILVTGGMPREELIEEPLEQLREGVEITGNTTSYKWREKIDGLMLACPDIKRVLILYRSIDELTRIHMREKNDIAAAFRHHKVIAIMHHIGNIEQSCDLGQQHLKDIDFVVITRSSQLISHVSSIVKACDRFNVPTLIPEHDSIPLGAFIGITNNIEREIGIFSGKQALKILEKQKKANDIPFTTLSKPQSIGINLQHQNQGLVRKAVENCLKQKNGLVKIELKRTLRAAM